LRHFLTILDRSTDELKWLIHHAIQLKKERQAGGHQTLPLKDKSVALIFEKSSTRTRVSFEVGVRELGGHALFLSKNDIQLGRGESVADTARVLSRYVHGIMLRTYGHSRVEELAKCSSVGVINGLTDDFHPCQIMADIMTFYERFNSFDKLKVAYIGDGNNITHSWLNGAARFGFELAVASPKALSVNKDFAETAIAEAKKTGAKITLTEDPREAIKGAQVVTTDVWASMGQEEESARRAEILRPYQVNAELMKLAAPEAIFLHCLPAHKGEEVTEDVFEAHADSVFDEAENRLHVQKAIMVDSF
jgi:ornithine carbamoyltransferase